MDIQLSSQSNEWHTPREFYDRLNEEFDFTLDAAATAENALCDRYFTEAVNGLAQSWVGERVWCNPPYGRGLSQWIKKAAISKAEVVVMLIPARTDTKAWHRWIFGNPLCEVRFIPGRLKFTGGGKNPNNFNAPFASALIIFKRTHPLLVR